MVPYDNLLCFTMIYGQKSFTLLLYVKYCFTDEVLYDEMDMIENDLLGFTDNYLAMGESSMSFVSYLIGEYYILL